MREDFPARLQDHIDSFEKLVAEAASLRPVLINSHSGHDSWCAPGKRVDRTLSAFRRWHPHQDIRLKVKSGAYALGTLSLTLELW